MKTCALPTKIPCAEYRTRDEIEAEEIIAYQNSDEYCYDASELFYVDNFTGSKFDDVRHCLVVQDADSDADWNSVATEINIDTADANARK